MNPTLPEQVSGDSRRRNARYQRLLVPAVMATFMSFVMSLVQTIIRIGFAPNLLPTWLASFAIGVVVAAPTAMLVAPRAQRLVGYLTGGPRH